MVAPDGERTMFTDRGANHNLQKEDLPASLLDDADVLHLTGYSFCEPPLLEVALWLLGQARSRDLAVTIDPGSAAFLARMEPGAFLRWTDGAAVCFPNRDEAAVLVGEADPVTMATRLTRHYGVVALKLGAAGCLLAVAGQPPVRVAALPGQGEGHHRRGRRVLRCIHEPVARERPGSRRPPTWPARQSSPRGSPPWSSPASALAPPSHSARGRTAYPGAVPAMRMTATATARGQQLMVRSPDAVPVPGPSTSKVTAWDAVPWPWPWTATVT